MEPLIFTTITFRSSGYSAEDRALLKETFTAFGPTRLRPHAMPEAGGSGEISIWMQIAITIRDGALEAAGAALLLAIVNAIKKFIDHKNQSQKPAEVKVIELQFDDVDIVINNPSDRIIESIAGIVEQANRGMTNGGMRNENVERIVIGYGGPDGHNDDMRYWSVSGEGEYDYIGRYDSENDILLKDLLEQDPE